MLRKFPSNKISGTKNALFFLLRAPAHYSFTFNLRFLYELRHKVSYCRLGLIKVYIFVQQNAGTL